MQLVVKAYQQITSHSRDTPEGFGCTHGDTAVVQVQGAVKGACSRTCRER